MPRLLVVTRAGREHTIVAEAEISVMQAIREEGIDDLLALCGGCCSCATCHVYVDDTFLELLPPMRDDENELLDCSNHRSVNSRLSCQIPLKPALDGLRVMIAPED